MEKKLQIHKPDVYNGSIDAHPTYQRWYETINDYLYHKRGTWDGDSHLIRVVGANLKGKARDWYDNRACQLRAKRRSIVGLRLCQQWMKDSKRVMKLTPPSQKWPLWSIREVSCPISISWLISTRRQTVPGATGEACLLRASCMSSERI